MGRVERPRDKTTAKMESKRFICISFKVNEQVENKELAEQEKAAI
jgi:hypothetical protein